MSKQPGNIKSESWTGKLPPDRPPQPLSTVRLSVAWAFLNVLVGTVGLILYRAVTRGRVDVPFFGRFTVSDGLAFYASVTYWVIALTLISMLLYVATKALRVRLKR